MTPKALRALNGIVILPYRYSRKTWLRIPLVLAQHTIHHSFTAALEQDSENSSIVHPTNLPLLGLSPFPYGSTADSKRVVQHAWFQLYFLTFFRSPLIIGWLFRPTAYWQKLYLSMAPPVPKPWSTHSIFSSPLTTFNMKAWKHCIEQKKSCCLSVWLL